MDIRSTVLTLGILTAVGAVWLAVSAAKHYRRGKRIPFFFKRRKLMEQAASLVIGAIAALVGLALERFTWPRFAPEGQKTILIQIAVAIVLIGGYFGWQQGILDQNRTEYPFAKELQASSASLAPERIAMFPKTNANLLFYLNADRPIPVLQDADQLRRFLETGRPGVVISQCRYVSQLPRDILNMLWSGQHIREQTQPWESRSSQQEKWVAWFWPRTTGTPQTTQTGESDDHAN